MTRRSVFSGALVAFLAAMIMTIVSIIIPRWISWDMHSSVGPPVHVNYGLHQRCSSLDGECHHFPSQAECLGDERTFCSLWRSVGFLMSFAVVVEGMTLIAFVVMIVGGKQKRQQGWKIVTGFLALGVAVQVAGMAIVARVKDDDPRFIKGFELDTSFQLCTASWVVILLTGVGIVASNYLLEEEGGYELIPGES